MEITTKKMENKNESLYDKLNSYKQSGVYPFHMPGHKRVSYMTENPYSYDITEIDGFDNLHHAKGVLRESMDMASELYGTKRTYYLVNGSTCGLLAAISSCVKQGGKILMARNCHKAVYNAVYLRRLDAKYVYPRTIDGMSMTGGIHPRDVEEILNDNPDTEAVIITSPTYEGIVSYVEAVAKVVHGHNIPLIVDEAHGAHFGMSEYFPKTAIECGADIVIQSVHKTLPSMTQTALLHVCSDMPDLEKIERFLSIYQSSSPSYVLMASIDGCIRDIIENGPEGFFGYVARLKEFRKQTEKFTHIKLLDKSILGKSGVYDLDEGKLVIVVNSKKYSGNDLYRELLQKYNLQMEMAASDYVIAMTSLMDSDEGFERLYKALENIDRNIRIDEGYGGNASEPFSEKEVYEKKTAVVCMHVSEALDSEMESVDFAGCSGRIAGEYVYLYPPGIPVIVPGEMIEKGTIDYLIRCKEQGLEVQGQADDTLKNIMVIKENWKGFNYGKNILPDGQKFVGEGYHV